MHPILNYYIENQKSRSLPQSDSELPSLVTLEVYEEMLIEYYCNIVARTAATISNWLDALIRHLGLDITQFLFKMLLLYITYNSDKTEIKVI